MRSVAPRVGMPEVTLATDQHEYAELTVARVEYGNGAQSVMSRWKFTDEEKAAIMRGEDLYLELFTSGPPQPVSLHIGAPEWSV